MANWTLFTEVLGLAVGAGLNLYAAVLVTGLGIRFGWLTNLPGELHLLANPIVLIVAGLMYAAEFVADKAPFFTPIWDGIHTVIRPAGGALLALGATADLDPTVRILAMLAAGTLAMGTHSSKMGFRLMAHATPEPTTHSVISVIEDISVVGILLLAFEYPWIALPILLAIIIGILAFLPLLFRIARFLVAGLFGRIRSYFSGSPSERPPAWVSQPDCTVRAYARKAKGVPRLTPGWLNTQTGQFQFRRWGVRREIAAGSVNPSLEWGFVYNIVNADNRASFYVTKDWCASLKTAATRTPA